MLNNTNITNSSNYSNYSNITNSISNSTSGKLLSGSSSIGDITKFFEISAFFLAFFGIYLIVVPLILRFLTKFSIIGIIRPIRRCNI
jgi:hypothetical protein